MLQIRKSDQRGTADLGWLYSRHTFSFGEYYDPRSMGFGPLRVINEDRVQPGAGFPPHGHQDMEILSYVLEGALEHKDSIGTGSVIRPGEVQIMSAGTGVRHSEFNHSKSEPVHFLQIWIEPDRQSIRPPDGRDGSLVIHRDVLLFAALLDSGEQVTHAPAKGRKAWLQVARGAVRVNGKELEAGDGVAVEDEPELTVAA